MKATCTSQQKMDKPLDLNSLLEGVLASKDKDMTRQLIDFSLNPSSILAAIRKTKNYSALKTFSSFIDFRDEKQRDLLLLLYTDAIVDGNLNELEKYINALQQPSRGQVAHACGKVGVDYRLVPEKFQGLSAYCSGLAESDNLEMLLRFADGLSTLVNVYESGGRGCAIKIMNHYGFSPYMVENYILGAFYGLNKEALVFLREYPKLIEDSFLRHIRGCFLSKQHSFFVACFRTDVITLSSAGWEKLQDRNKVLYDALRDDV